jgi:hypothetical protein
MTKTRPNELAFTPRHAQQTGNRVVRSRCKGVES